MGQAEEAPQSSDKQLWEKFLEWDQEAHIMSAAITETDCQDFALPNGLVPDHAYSIIELAMVQNVRLVKIRNPHGKGNQWNGKWSESDTETWSKHQDIRTELKAYTEADHATFWMSWEDLVKEFDQLQVCPHKLTKPFATEMT